MLHIGKHAVTKQENDIHVSNKIIFGTQYNTWHVRKRKQWTNLKELGKLTNIIVLLEAELIFESRFKYIVCSKFGYMRIQKD